MRILEPLPAGSMLGVPFTDYLNVTVPHEFGDEVVSLILPIIEATAPFSETEPGTYRLFNSQLKATGAVFKIKKRGKVRVISASGQALDALRSARLYGSYLQALASVPHRISMLHATQDYMIYSPSEYVLAVKDAAFSELLFLTQKRLLKTQVKAITAPGLNGQETGTVYLGNRANADVWAKVYDKQQERLERGYSDPGPVVRVEVAVQSDVGATLKDALDPRDLFFKYASRSLVEVPSGFVGWEPAGEGYVLGERFEVLPLARLERLMDFSLDVAHLVDIARQCYGPKAGDVLSRLFHKKCDQADIAGLVPQA